VVRLGVSIAGSRPHPNSVCPRQYVDRACEARHPYRTTPSNRLNPKAFKLTRPRTAAWTSDNVKWADNHGNLTTICSRHICCIQACDFSSSSTAGARLFSSLPTKPYLISSYLHLQHNLRLAEKAMVSCTRVCRMEQNNG
jgi:hypothetical protein